MDDAMAVVRTKLLVPRVLGPGVRGPLVDDLADVDEAGIDHLLLVALGAIAVALDGRGGLEHGVGPFLDGSVGLHAAVVALNGEGDVLQLHPAAGLEVAGGWVSGETAVWRG
jgi:hypothetical protein